MSAGEYSVYRFFTPESLPESILHEAVLRFVDAKTAIDCARALITAASVQPEIHRVIITDGGDFTTFEWIRALGIVFPPQEGETMQ